jgi:hypothetical protein
MINTNVKVRIQRTDGEGIPNGAYHGVSEDGDGGFFGTTKFYYGKDKFLQGTGECTEGIEGCNFIFNKI